MDAKTNDSRAPDISPAPIDHDLERLQLRSALTGVMRRLESNATLLDQLGRPAQAQSARDAIEIAEATLAGPAAVDALWKHLRTTTPKEA